MRSECLCCACDDDLLIRNQVECKFLSCGLEIAIGMAGKTVQSEIPLLQLLCGEQECRVGRACHRGVRSDPATTVENGASSAIAG